MTGSEGDTGQWPAAILLEGNFERPRLWLGIIVGETRTLKKEIAGATEEHLELVWKVGTRKRMLRSEGGKVPVFRSENTITTCDLREGHVRDRVGRAPLWAQAWNVVLFLVLYVCRWGIWIHTQVQHLVTPSFPPIGRYIRGRSTPLLVRARLSENSPDGGEWGRGDKPGIRVWARHKAQDQMGRRGLALGGGRDRALGGGRGTSVKVPGR